MGKPQVFRANVGIAVANDRGEVLALERSDRRGAWQLPQGGLDAGEEPFVAALRELGEETGLPADAVDHVATHPAWLTYELPPAAQRRGFRGQAQKWFLFRLRAGVTVDLAQAKSREFSAFRWQRLEALAREVWEVRRPIYEELARYFAPHLTGR
jgi:putative (di)nucleoside polyphosphate hydrolase